MDILGTKMLVLNSLKSMVDLLDKRGGNYSHRPVLTVAGELMGLDNAMSLKPYGTDWRACRKLEHAALNPTAVRDYHPMQEQFAALLASDILANPTNFYDLTRLCAARIVLSITYGISASIIDTEYIAHAEETMKIVGEAVVPGAFLCDLLPILKYSPSWVPFQRKAARGKQMIDDLVATPFRRVKRELEAGRTGPSLVRSLLTSLSTEELTSEMEHRIKWTAGSMYSAGGESTFGTTLVFMIAMALHPDKQANAQAEIDSVIGCDRLPLISDRPVLPYVDALVKEVMRWHPMLPLSLARRSDKDDVYEGYFIPKNTIVSPNLWALAFEPNEKYPPKQFIPERFLDPACPTTDPYTWAFGFGRRGCPGKGVAEASVFILIATFLSSVNVHPPKNGPLVPEYMSQLVSLPKRFDCLFESRSDEKREMLRAASA